MTVWVIIRIFSLYWLSIFAARWEPFDKKKASLHTFIFNNRYCWDSFIGHFIQFELVNQKLFEAGGRGGLVYRPFKLYLSIKYPALSGWFYGRQVLVGKINNNQWTEEETTIFANTVGCCSYKVLVLSLFWFVTGTCVLPEGKVTTIQWWYMDPGDCL